MFLGVQRVLNLSNIDSVLLICLVTSVNINNIHMLWLRQTENTLWLHAALEQGTKGTINLASVQKHWEELRGIL